MRLFLVAVLFMLSGCEGSMSREAVMKAKASCAKLGMRAVFFIDGTWDLRVIGEPHGVRCMDDDGLLFELAKEKA